MDRYTESTTTLTEAAVQQLGAAHKANTWTNPRTGKVRYYLDVDALRDIIGLDAEYYKTGNVRHCSYIDAEGDEVSVANSRAYGKYTKTFIENGKVYTEWAPYGADIAELIASNIAKDAEPEAISSALSAAFARSSRMSSRRRSDMDFTYPNLFALAALVILVILLYIFLLRWMWKGVRNDLKRWKKMTEEEQDNFYRWTVFRVMTTVLILVFGIGTIAFSYFMVLLEVL